MYTVSSADSALVLGSGFGIGKDQKFRGQRILVEIKVPVGHQIRFDESVSDKLDITNIRVLDNNRNWNRRDWDIEWNGDSFYDWQSNVDYTMTENGELVDLAHLVTPNRDSVYEYNDGAARRIDSQIQKLQQQRQEQIERQRQKVEEENRRLQELENSNPDTEKQNTGKINTKIIEKGSLEAAGIFTPVFSLLI